MSKQYVKFETMDFLFSSYFGVVPKDLEVDSSEDLEKLKKGIALNCAHRAYRDFNRTLRFNSGADKVRKKFRDDLCEIIVSEIQTNLLGNGNDFDEKHNNACKVIRSKAEGWSENGIQLLKGTVAFSYGQTQKWLNMTIKYMWLVGLWDDELKVIKDKLHIPVDRYILKAASTDRKEKGNRYGLMFKGIPCKHNYDCSEKERNVKKYSEFGSQPWSQWDETDYKGFIQELREKFVAEKQVDPDLGETLMDWEAKAWVEQVKIESKKGSR